MTACTKQASEIKSSTQVTDADVTLSTDEIPQTVEICGETYDTSITEWSNDSGNLTTNDLQNLKYLTKLKKLTIAYGKLSDLSFLQQMSNLEELNITGSGIPDISDIKNLKNLSVLNLCYNKITDVSALKDLTNLASINLSNNHITDISALSKLNKIKSLDMSNNPLNVESIKKGTSQLSEMVSTPDEAYGYVLVRDVYSEYSNTDLEKLKEYFDRAYTLYSYASGLNKTSFYVDTGKCVDGTVCKGYNWDNYEDFCNEYHKIFSDGFDNKLIKRAEKRTNVDGKEIIQFGEINKTDIKPSTVYISETETCVYFYSLGNDGLKIMSDYYLDKDTWTFRHFSSFDGQTNFESMKTDKTLFNDKDLETQFTKLFDKANELYGIICGFDDGIIVFKNINGVWCADSENSKLLLNGCKTLDDFKNLYYAAFEKNYADSFIEESVFHNDDGSIQIGGSRGCNITLFADDFVPVSKTDNKIVFKCVAVYENSPDSMEPPGPLKIGDDGNWYDENGKLYVFTERYQIKEFPFVLEKIDGVWKFTEFNLWY